MKAQKGFTLIEILVALLILGFGLLGLAGMQISGMKNATDSVYRTTASMLARDLADRMHANPRGVDNDDYIKTNDTAISCTTPPAKNCDTGGALCSVDETAIWDMFSVYCGSVGGSSTDKKYGIDSQLPDGKLRVLCQDMDTTDGDPCSHFSPHRILITWKERAESTGKQKKSALASDTANNARTRTFELVVSVR